MSGLSEALGETQRRRRLGLKEALMKRTETMYQFKQRRHSMLALMGRSCLTNSFCCDCDGMKRRFLVPKLDTFKPQHVRRVSSTPTLEEQKARREQLRKLYMEQLKRRDPLTDNGLMEHHRKIQLEQLEHLRKVQLEQRHSVTDNGSMDHLRKVQLEQLREHIRKLQMEQLKLRNSVTILEPEEPDNGSMEHLRKVQMDQLERSYSVTILEPEEPDNDSIEHLRKVQLEHLRKLQLRKLQLEQLKQHDSVTIVEPEEPGLMSF